VARTYHSISSCVIVCCKSDTIATIIETFPRNVTFIRDLICPRLVTWNVLLQCLANVQLEPRTDGFRNLYENCKFSFDYLYKVLLQLEVSFDNN
jgi:hypothetical protein